MTFHKGHQINGNPSGLSKEKRKQLMSLALDIRSAVPVHEIREWLVKIWQTGIDPLTGDKVDLKMRKECLETLLNRGWGQAAQHVIVEAEVRQRVIGDEDDAPARKLTLAEIQERRQALRQLGVRPRVIEASAFERRDAELLEAVNPPDIDENQA